MDCLLMPPSLSRQREVYGGADIKHHEEDPKGTESFPEAETSDLAVPTAELTLPRTPEEIDLTGNRPALEQTANLQTQPSHGAISIMESEPLQVTQPPEFLPPDLSEKLASKASIQTYKKMFVENKSFQGTNCENDPERDNATSQDHLKEIEKEEETMETKHTPKETEERKSKDTNKETHQDNTRIEQSSPHQEDVKPPQLNSVAETCAPHSVAIDGSQATHKHNSEPTDKDNAKYGMNSHVTHTGSSKTELPDPPQEKQENTELKSVVREEVSLKQTSGILEHHEDTENHERNASVKEDANIKVE